MTVTTMPVRPDTLPLTERPTELPILFPAPRPAGLRSLPAERLPELAAEIRGFLIEKVCAAGDRLRQPGGMSGYPCRSESAHDVIENSHASTALSYADGFAKGFKLTGERGGHVIAVVGDGAMTGGIIPAYQLGGAS
jgi:1-deoxy-D-xylulose-5-phosphate synthase